MMYNKVVEEFFFSPQHEGSIEDRHFCAHSKIGEIGQILLIDLYLQCMKNGIINKACFKAKGNPFVIAAMEWLCRGIEGTSLDEHPLLSYAMMMKQLEIPNSHIHVALQIEGVYKEALSQLNAQFER